MERGLRKGETMDGKLALALTDMRLAHVDRLLRQLTYLHPEAYEEPLSSVLDLVRAARCGIDRLKALPATDSHGPGHDEFT